MRLFIDADACPVTDIAVRLAREYEVECILICDTSHLLEREGTTTVVVDKGADSADFALVNRISAGDIAVTQDYGLAAMCLAKRALPISQNGFVYDENNIGALLEARHAAKKYRLSGGRLKGPHKRTAAQDQAFEALLLRLLTEINNENGLSD